MSRSYGRSSYGRRAARGYRRRSRNPLRRRYARRY